MKKKKNIIVYFVDQQRWDTVGAYGQTLNVTPNLDLMAKEGTRFENAFTCQPVCGPARACLQTGKYATELGCCVNGVSLPLGEKTLAGYLNEAGYETGYVGKWHLASDLDSNHYETVNVPVERRGGYRYWRAADVLEFTSHGYDGYVFDTEGNKVEFTGYRADCITDFAIEFLEQQTEEKPFFLFLSHIEPHHQNDRGHYEGPEGSKDLFKGFIPPADLENASGNWREEYPDYLGCCNRLDYNLGRVRETLRRQNLEEDTVIFYLSDHGSHFQTRNWEYKRSCHEASIRIPLVAYGGPFTGGGVVREMTSLLDLPRTVLECAGLTPPEEMRGISLIDFMDGKRPCYRDTLFIQISESQIGRCIRTPRWKYSVAAAGDGWTCFEGDSYCEEFLYDLQQDPAEQNNLVRDPDCLLVRSMLAERLIYEMTLAGEKVPRILPAREGEYMPGASPAMIPSE
ncbi:sulfatase-like hydrolase/transferase [Hungatella effluvii]|uniref:sulfatase-like hydrolase/transferase n=1 Tax=Hungatella effluvii TaxID=1096246 RepID=UPI0022E98148|nr:sulfatase-like hydrolase/transferase [Hungatella effluvii]